MQAYEQSLSLMSQATGICTCGSHLSLLEAAARQPGLHLFVTARIALAKKSDCVRTRQRQSSHESYRVHTRMCEQNCKDT